MRSRNWHNLSERELLGKLKTSRSGLSEAEAQKRIKKYGQNSFPEKKRFTYFAVALSQLKSPLVYILLIAAAISFLLGEYVDASVILFAVFLNTVTGFVQEVKAEEALAALDKMIEHSARIIREGVEKEIDAKNIVVGDILILKTGDRIPADARILESHEMEVDEAALTGESMPLEKSAEGLDRAGTEDSKSNMAYAGSSVVKGRSLAVVTDIAVNTKFGQIAELVASMQEGDTPLQKELKGFSNFFGLSVFGILLFILAIGIYRSVPFIEIFTTAVAIAVAAIPEGMLVAVTIILAVGMQRILKSGSLVRKLVAAETLGSVTIICTDKTGTLTQGTMQVDHIVTADSFFSVGADKKMGEVMTEGDHMEALRIGLICNDAVVENPKAELQDWAIHGDYTEKAFLRAGIYAGFDLDKLKEESLRINEIPFNSDRKFMATLNRENGDYVVYAKGAAEEIINRCGHVFVWGKIREMGEDDFRSLKQKQAEMSRKGLRVMGVAFKKINKDKVNLFNESREDDMVSSMVFVGLVALKDPLRAEAKSTLDTAKKAGIRTVIITGDSALTAKAIANELGMKVGEENILEGHQLDHMSTAEFNNVVDRIKVYARVSPRHKSRIVDAWQSRGEVVAMTGDGVNDAPALKKADIGVALGSGTEVAKETADMVLLDNNFRTIVTAVQEGRVIFENIRKVILYLISDSFSEVVVVGGSLLMASAVPVTAAQILWINLITDGLPNAALTLEPCEKGIMLRKPRKRKEAILSEEMKALVVAISFVSGVIALTVFNCVNVLSEDFQRASTIAFSILSVDSLIYVFSLRSLSSSIFRQNPFSNIYLILAVILAFLFQLIAIYHPFFGKILQTVPLGLGDWAIVFTASMFTLVTAEAVKYLYRPEK